VPATNAIILPPFYRFVSLVLTEPAFRLDSEFLPLLLQSTRPGASFGLCLGYRIEQNPLTAGTVDVRLTTTVLGPDGQSNAVQPIVSGQTTVGSPVVEGVLVPSSPIGQVVSIEVDPSAGTVEWLGYWWIAATRPFNTTEIAAP
jgi:hypothetical protein